MLGSKCRHKTASAKALANCFHISKLEITAVTTVELTGDRSGAVFSGSSSAATTTTAAVGFLLCTATVITTSVSQRKCVAVIVSKTAFAYILSAFFDIITRYRKRLCIQSE